MMPPPAPSTTTSPSTTTAVIVARHGERHDYNCILAQTNWVATATRPWDPPLSEHGHDQGRKLGLKIQQILTKENLSPLTAVYSSPLLRCRQTAVAAASTSSRSKVRVELGLVESLNEDWYRSWAMPNSNGEWGFKEKDHHKGVPIDIKTIIEPAKRSVLELLQWKEHSINGMDEEYESHSRIPSSYSWGTFESAQHQRDRMFHVMEHLTQQHPGETILLLSHGGPVTHLYEQLTEKDWWVHGEASYASFSLYSLDVKRNSWKPRIINESKYLEEHL